MFENTDRCFPTDEMSGGTWCGINTYGLVFCLLNRYDAPKLKTANLTSRGALIPHALSFASVDEASAYIQNLDLSQYNGFQLLMISVNKSVCHNWDTQHHRIDNVPEVDGLFRSSSSVQSLRIPQQRALRFQHWREHQQALSVCSIGDSNNHTIPSMHLREPGVAPNEAIFMVRESTHTKSITQLTVTADHAALRYWPAQLGWRREKSCGWRRPLVDRGGY